MCSGALGVFCRSKFLSVIDDFAYLHNCQIWLSVCHLKTSPGLEFTRSPDLLVSILCELHKRRGRRLLKMRMILKVILLSFPCWSICHSLTTQQNCTTGAAFENIHYLKTQRNLPAFWLGLNDTEVWTVNLQGL